MATGNEYVLDRGYIAALRLNAQHLLWKEQLGYVIHPKVSIIENMKVADVGAGTGYFNIVNAQQLAADLHGRIWLVEVANILPPSSELHGYDIDVSQFPPKQWLPKNVFTLSWDAFSEVPAAMVEQYDIIHIGIFMLLIANNNPLPILKNLMRMLKPGGYLQWDELDWATKRIVRADPSIPSDDTRALFDYVSKWEDALGPKEWIADLPKIYTSQGLESVSFERFVMPPEYLRYDTDKSLTAYEEFSHTILDRRGQGEGEQLRDLVNKAAQECRNGVAMTVDLVVAVARKPNHCKNAG
ncbi:MAG: hypothetical protein Q9225_001269 [Loekoesia sp. 1 TL-2023]